MGGAQVGGANVGGANVGGANVGGAKVGGAKVGGVKVSVLLLCDILSQHVIRSHMHDVYTEEVNKVALSAEDDKRVIMEDGIHTLAYGHYRLKKLRGFIGLIFQSRCFQKINLSMTAVCRNAAFVSLIELALVNLLNSVVFYVPACSIS